jgi:hypothetical protein
LFHPEDAGMAFPLLSRIWPPTQATLLLSGTTLLFINASLQKTASSMLPANILGGKEMNAKSKNRYNQLSHFIYLA